MSSPFSFDNWDQLLDSSPAPSPSASTAVPTPSSASTGEFQPFVAVGLSVAGGGGDRKGFSLLYGEHAENLCCGVIGTSKFCLRLATACGVMAHTKKFEIEPTLIYLKENENRAFIKPVFEAGNLNESDLAGLLAEKHTLQDLSRLLEKFKDKAPEASSNDTEQVSTVSEGNNLFKSLGVESGSLMLQPSFDLDSPKFVTDEAGIFSAVPQLSFDVEAEDDDIFELLASSHSSELVSILQDFQSRFVNLKTKWSQTFLEVDSSHSIVVKDLKMLCDRMRELKIKVNTLTSAFSSKEFHMSTQFAAISSEIRQLEESCLSSSSQVQLIQQEQRTLSATFQSSQEEQEMQLQTLHSSLSTLETKFSTVDRYLKEFEKRFAIIFPILREVRQLKINTESTHMEPLHKQLRDLTDKVESIEQMAWQQVTQVPSPTSVTHSVTVDVDLKDIKHQMKILQHRIVGGGVKIGLKVFQSFEDVQVWVKAELPTRRYGLFVDAVSILDFFSCLGHIDAEIKSPHYTMRIKQDSPPFMNLGWPPRSKIYSPRSLVKAIRINTCQPFGNLTNGTMEPMDWSTRLHVE
jgi:hypothetical protein